MILRKSSILPWEFSLIKTVPQTAGVYVLRNGFNSILYIGTAEKSNLRETLLRHYKKNNMPEIKLFDWYQVKTQKQAKRLKSEWLERYQPSHL